ncbi:hypothetical protein VTK73DRAFT_9188 [Phialemonium thermophilum]|uniref:Aminoglycoside phosphotransferase domain-containing protein n=1 Tax=Phialemonium thermophilum TaxID=223376 RepID=A0ABR3W3X0_9PEZI
MPLTLPTPARYFARCWSQPQHPSPEARGQTQDGIRRRLALLRASPSSGLGDCVVSEGEQSLPLLFAPAYPQVLSHGDLSRTNILVDEDSYEITGIVDWSRAEILPFGMDLDCLYLTTGYLDFEGWHDYACRSQLHEAFWTEFWSASGMGDDGQRSEIRHWAERAARIGAVLRYAFRRNADGSASEILAPEGSLAWRQLRTWLTT